MAGLSEREERLLVLLNIRDGEGFRCATEPEHDADVFAGIIWFVLGNYWRPGEWELQWDRTLSQSYSHTFRRLREKEYVSCHDEPQEALGQEFDPAGYYFLTEKGATTVEALAIPADLKRRCGYKGCDRWLPPNEKSPACGRCRFSREFRETGRYRGRTSSDRRSRRGPGYEEYMKTGTGDIVAETLVSKNHALAGMAYMRVLKALGKPSLLETAPKIEVPEHLSIA